MPQNSFSIQPFEAKRVRFESTRSTFISPTDHQSSTPHSH